MAKTTKNKEIKEETFLIDSLKNNCHKLFGISETVFVGATYDMKGKYTIKEVKEKIKDWKKRSDK